MERVFITTTIITSLLSFQQEVKSQSVPARNKKTETAVTSEKAAIEKLNLAYQDALNASDASKVMAL